jgi:hypothetical protein
MDSSSLEAGKLVNAPVTAVIASASDSPELGAKAQSVVHKEGRRATVGSSDRTWQRRLLPLMVGLLVTLTAFFIVASFVQLYYLQTRIEKAPRLDLGPAMTSLDEIAKDMQSGKIQDPRALNSRIEQARWQTLSILEANVLQRRYHHAGVLLISRIWTRYLGFVTGTILAMVGAAFILGKLQEASSNLGAEGGLWKVSLTTASPGLVLAALGTILMPGDPRHEHGSLRERRTGLSPRNVRRRRRGASSTPGPERCGTDAAERCGDSQGPEGPGNVQEVAGGSRTPDGAARGSSMWRIKIGRATASRVVVTALGCCVALTPPVTLLRTASSTASRRYGGRETMRGQRKS